MKNFSKNQIQILIVFIVFVNALGLIFTPVLRNHTSILYANVAKNIVDTNDWMNLYYNQTDWLDKPHFQFWMTALSYKIFGINTFAYTLPGFLFNLIGAFYTYLLSKRLFGYKIGGFLSVLFYLTSFRLLICTLSVKQEAFLLGEIIPACYYWYLYNDTVGIKKKYLLLGSFFTALGMMTKGPFVLFPIFSGVFGIWIFEKKYKDFKIDTINIKQAISFCFKWFLPLGLSLIFILPELVSLYIQFDLHPEKLVFGKTHVSGIRWFFIDSQFGRFFNTGPIVRPPRFEAFTRHFYYVHVFLWAFFPWIATLPFAVINVFKNKKITPRPQPNTAVYINLRKQYVFLFCSFLPTFVLFSLTAFQMDIYINILIPFACILCAQWVVQSKFMAQYFTKAVVLPSVLMSVISLATTINFVKYSKYDASYQVAKYLKSKENLPLIDVNILGKNFEFFSQYNQYKEIGEDLTNTISEENFITQTTPYYLAIKNTDWDNVSSTFKNTHQFVVLNHFYHMGVQVHKKIMLKKLLFMNKKDEKDYTDILLIKVM